ncbi:dipeptidase 1 precursor [Rhizoclosmatium globosum]|uniref:Dipeptidase n=1 Tax=Rhizoclosmatium globosum TaxID=329046 RepID=A0A1Y2CVJ6_9FUNG|nr:dipeptidase 1 precursor [Rhizoclosmatium globosum]|eukprot:ORY50916.1 dipeptidase 1 precursor [Rhizoclosmatium globosum]
MVSSHGLDSEPWSPLLPRAPPNESPLEAAQRILRHAPVIDTHNDWPGKLNWILNSKLHDKSLVNLPPSQFHTDITRIRAGNLGVQFWSAYVGCAEYTKQTNAVQETLNQIDLIKRLVAKYPNEFAFARTVADIRAAARKGKVASLIGIEGGHQIDGSMGVLRQYFELGVRYMTLTHSCHTAWADSCSLPPIHNGISSEGHRFIREMNRLGMMIDISHVSADAMRQSIEASKAPVIFSHSSAYSVTPVPRNVPDDVLRMLKDKDGVVMINFMKAYTYTNETTKMRCLGTWEHMSHIKKVVGAQYIGIGADFDGSGIDDFALKDVSKYPELVVELLRRKFTEQEIIGITGSNLLRVMEKVEKVAAKMQKDDEKLEEVGIIVEKTC